MYYLFINEKLAGIFSTQEEAEQYAADLGLSELQYEVKEIC